MEQSLLPDVKLVNINHKGSWQGAISAHFHENFRKEYRKNLFFSIISFGVFSYKKYKKAKKDIAQALSARKVFYFQALQDYIEEIRKEQNHLDPRQALNAIFMKVQSEKVGEEEEALEFKAIYYPNEILLFITNPVRRRKNVRLYRLESQGFDYLKMWYEIKKKARVNQYRQIQDINFYNETLKIEFCLTRQGIHDRLSRSSICRKHPFLLTKFRELSQSFQEILGAYQDFDELGQSHPELYHLIETLAQTSKQDIEILQTYLASRYLPKDLPLQNRRQLIQLGNQQEVLYNMSKEQQFELCALILNQYQWNFLLSIQEVSQVTLNLLDWAFEESPKQMKPSLSFLEKTYPGIDKRVTKYAEEYPSLNEKIKEDETLNMMTLDFAKELNREWPAIYLYNGDQLLFKNDKSDSLTIDKLIEVYKKLQELTGIDETLFSLLQQSLSQRGKNAFQSTIEDGIVKLLGEKSEYFIPILSNSDITIVKKESNAVNIHYHFEQIILRKGEVQHPFEKEKHILITQPLIQEEGHWTSPDPEVKVESRNKVI